MVKWSDNYTQVVLSMRDCINTTYINVTDSLFPNNTQLTRFYYAELLVYVQNKQRYNEFCRALIDGASFIYRYIKFDMGYIRDDYHNTITRSADISTDKKLIEDHIFAYLDSGYLARNCTNVGILSIDAKINMTNCFETKRKESIWEGTRYKKHVYE